jgi:glycosyltransferase involved in cell wall biosynthesis
MADARPFFSICIPQHNRTSFLIEALRTLDRQTFRDFEVCISDDASTDGREADLLRYLDGSGLNHRYVRQEKNLRYDGNLRAAITLARGRYCFLLGNDDGLSTPYTLGRIAEVLQAHGEPPVALTNYREVETGLVYRRVTTTGVIATGIEAAVTHFRSFSFVSGVILDTDIVHEHATAQWDASEMYQVFLAARALAQGGSLLAIDEIAVDKDLRVAGESVDSYAAKPRVDPCPVVPRKFNLSSFPAVVSGAIAPYAGDDQLTRLNARILMQLYAYTYPYWLVEFRRVQSWKYALGIALGQRPSEMAHGLHMSPLGNAAAGLTFLFSTLGGLLAPVGVTQKWVAPLFYKFAKRAPQ